MKIHSVTSRLVVSLTTVIVLMGCVLPMSPTPPPAQPPMPSPTPQLPAPTLMSEFKSTSGRTVIEYYAYDSGTCGIGNCNFRGPIHALPGFDQVEVFLSGFRLETQSKVDAITNVQAQVQKFRYDKATGELEVGVNGQLSTGSGQPYAYHVTFVVILTDATAAKFTAVGHACGGQAQCHVTATLAGAVPTGMQYIGLGTQIFDLRTDQSGPLRINTLSAHIDSLTVTPPNVQLDYLCSLSDAAGMNAMSCEWGAAIIAFDPAEMAQNTSTIFPQYSFLGSNITGARRWTNHSQPAAGTAFTGYLDAFEGLTFFYPTGQENALWMVEAAASNFQLSGTPPTEALTDYGIFLGTTFGDTMNAQTYTYQESRAFGFLR